MSIETNFDIGFISQIALKEKQIQQNYRPLIAIHKWFARRPGTLFRGLVISEFGESSVKESFFQNNAYPGRTIADPFMGGGTPLMEANRVGCDIHGFDINPMSAWIVREELEEIDLAKYDEECSRILDNLESDLGHLYKTDCIIYGTREVPVKYFLWVKTLDCRQCKTKFDLFPNYRIAAAGRHPRHVIVCSQCGELNECASTSNPGKCVSCHAAIQVQGPAKRGKCACPSCGTVNTYPRQQEGPLSHRLFAIEYYNPEYSGQHHGRFFKRPDQKDLTKIDEARKVASRNALDYCPIQQIMEGDETTRLLRWGYKKYSELFSARQLYSLNEICRRVSAVNDERIRHALATNLSDLTRGSCRKTDYKAPIT